MENRIYLDNAATTPLDSQVVEAMLPYLHDFFGNPSSIHMHGRKVRSAIEMSRKKVAELLGVAPAEIFFTSGGTEADNTALRCTVECCDIQQLISSPIEHHAVLHTLEDISKKHGIPLRLLQVDENGQINLDELTSLLKQHPNKSLVSLMHANNEIGNLIDLNVVGDLCYEYGAVLHSDTVQTIGHYPMQLEQLPVHMVVGAAHKFHGPKGVGFLYVKGNHKIHPFITGGAQERNMRGGTENVYGIVGLAKALEIATEEHEQQIAHVKSLKMRMITRLQEEIEGVAFHGMSGHIDQSLYTLLNVDLPKGEDNDMLLFNLDIQGVSASGGSACSSGTDIGSHVLAALNADPSRGAVRFSFSKYNTLDEIDRVVDLIKEMYTHKV
ncbi:MAG: cysteine desulfurase [Cyclobacteriaceae bacterium]|nr:cysteine desulfurase [Cyclobacteriaceae bacterium]MCH8516306.1 cysteine desulfurase [Cyclobacteriaceae bacterium]